MVTGQIFWSSWSHGFKERCVALGPYREDQNQSVRLSICSGAEPQSFTVVAGPGTGLIRVSTLNDRCLGVGGSFELYVVNCSNVPERSFVMPGNGEGEIRWVKDQRKCIGVAEDLSLALQDCPEDPDVRLQFILPTRTYQDMVGKRGYEFPDMYGQVDEKTMWGYWYNPVDCPSSTRCKLPAIVQLCIDTIEKNRGSFTFRLVHLDEVEKYVNRFDLPLRWNDLLHPAQQKDSLMNALLARYGGIAVDLTQVLLRPVDDWWERMVNDGVVFRGYWYRGGGELAVWFLMARRETVFRIVANSQLIRMGDDVWPFRLRGETKQYFGLGDGMVSPVLCQFDHSYCKWFEGDHGPGFQPSWSGSTAEPLSFAKISTSDPMETVQLPYSGDPYDMPVYNVNTRTEEWNTFKERYAAGLKLVKMFQQGGGAAKHRTREELLGDKDSFFYHWLCLAGHPDTSPEVCAGDHVSNQVTAMI